MRAIGTALVAMTMMASSALAEAPATQGALAPGKPAGAKQAQLEAGGVLLVAGIVAIAAVIAVVASTTQGNSTPATTS
jgi:hypothetical protein